MMQQVYQRVSSLRILVLNAKSIVIPSILRADAHITPKCARFNEERLVPAASLKL